MRNIDKLLVILFLAGLVLNGISCGDVSGPAVNDGTADSEDLPDSEDTRLGNERDDSEPAADAGGNDGGDSDTADDGEGDDGGGIGILTVEGFTNLSRGRFANSYNPSWLPDGSGLVFTAETSSGSLGLYKINWDGSGLTALTDDPDHDYVNLPGSSICMQDNRLVISADRADHDDIWIFNLDTYALQQVTNDLSPDWEPTWSPDCSWIVFQSKRGGNWDIYKIKADGTALTRLSTDTAKDWEPNWSPAGDQIVFQSYQNYVWGLYLVSPDGSGLSALSEIDGEAADPSWSPDGAEVIFSGDAESSGSEDIITIEIGSGVITNLTDHPGYEGAPAFSHDGRSFAFEADWDGAMDIWTNNR